MRKLTLSALSAACLAVAGVAIAQGTMSPQPGSPASATAPTTDRSAPTSATGGATNTTPGGATTTTPGSSGSSSMDANRNTDGTMRVPRQDRN